MTNFEKAFTKSFTFSKWLSQWLASLKPLMLVESGGKRILALDSDPKSGSFVAYQGFQSKSQNRLFILQDKEAKIIKQFANPKAFKAALNSKNWIESQRNALTFFKNDENLYNVASTRYLNASATLPNASTKVPMPNVRQYTHVPQDSQIGAGISLTKPIPKWLTSLNELTKGRDEHELMAMRALVQSKLNKMYSGTIFNS